MKLLDSEILYLDNHLLVVNKPPLLLTLPTEERDSVQTRGQAFLKEKYNKIGNVFLHPVHRLDRVATGIVVCARTSKALSRLNAQIRDRAWEKTYIVHHEGVLPALKGTLSHKMRKEEYRSVIDPAGDEAILHYRVLEPGKAVVRLITGRYHQIRLQFATVGCPILGDKKYGAREGDGPIALCHAKLCFSHPVTKERLKILVQEIQDPL